VYETLFLLIMMNVYLKNRGAKLEKVFEFANKKVRSE